MSACPGIGTIPGNTFPPGGRYFALPPLAKPPGALKHSLTEGGQLAHSLKSALALGIPELPSPGGKGDREAVDEERRAPILPTVLKSALSPTCPYPWLTPLSVIFYGLQLPHSSSDTESGYEEPLPVPASPGGRYFALPPLAKPPGALKRSPVKGYPKPPRNLFLKGREPAGFPGNASFGGNIPPEIATASNLQSKFSCGARNSW